MSLLQAFCEALVTDWPFVGGESTRP